jgi:polyisoprenoid-binding protein YceI
MKTTLLKFVPITAFTIALIACGGKKEAIKTEDKKDVLQATELSTNYSVDLTSSALGWKGTKVGGGHNGTINISEGTISVEKNNITAGNFVIDMKTIKVIDLAGTDGEAKLKEHLESPDFFEIGKYPTAKFEITGSEKLAAADSLGNNYKIMGNLTIKDVTKNITIPANVTMDATQFAATSKFNLDRTDFNVKYKSAKFDAKVKDKAIGDIMEFDLKLKATPKQ